MKTNRLAIGTGLLAFAAISVGGFFFLQDGSAPQMVAGTDKTKALQTAREAGEKAAESPDARTGGVRKLPGAFEDSPSVPVAEVDTAVVVQLPPGADSSALNIREVDPRLRLPASLAVSNSAGPFSPKQEAAKQKIARKFLQTVTQARGLSHDVPELATAWTSAQRIADQEYLDVIGAGTYGRQIDQLNPEIEEQATARRIALQKRALDDLATRQMDVGTPSQSFAPPPDEAPSKVRSRAPSSTPEPASPTMPTPALPVTEQEGAAIRRANQRYQFWMHYGAIPAWLAE